MILERHIEFGNCKIAISELQKSEISIDTMLDLVTMLVGIIEALRSIFSNQIKFIKSLKSIFYFFRDFSPFAKKFLKKIKNLDDEELKDLSRIVAEQSLNIRVQDIVLLVQMIILLKTGKE